MINDIHTLKSSQQEDFIKYFFQLVRQFLGSTGIQRNIFIYIDNNILQDLKQKDSDSNRKLRSLVFYSFMDFLAKQSNLKISIVITPIIFFEFSGRNKSLTHDEFIAKIKHLEKLLNVFKFEIYYKHFNSYDTYIQILDDIKEDEQAIIDALEKLKDVPVIKLKTNGVETFSLPHAFTLVPETIKLKYFAYFYVHFILASKIDKALLEHELNDDIRKKYIQHTFDFPLSSLIKTKKGRLEGLGDIELFQECDMSSQYLLDQKHINAVMTFDENLYEVLSRRQTMIASHAPIYGQDPKIIQQEKLNEFFSATNSMLIAYEREEVFFESAIMYLDELLK